MLIKPRKNLYCQTLDEELEAGCSSDCRVDYDSLIEVPAPPKFEFIHPDEEIDPCVMKGSRMLTARAVCVK